VGDVVHASLSEAGTLDGVIDYSAPEFLGVRMPGLMTRVTRRLLVLAAGIWHNWTRETGQIDKPSRSLIAYDH
jgi:hypothetical protein